MTDLPPPAAHHPGPPPSRLARVTVPADVDRPDTLLFGLTARQLAVLAPTLLLAAAAYRLAADRLPLPLAAAVVTPLLAAGLAAALARRGGLPLDRYAAAALAHHRAPKLALAAPDGVPAAPGWLPDVDAALRGSAPVPARPVARDVDPAGVVDLGGDVCVIAEVEGTSWALAGPADRDACVAAWAGLLNALTGPVQVTVRSAPVRLEPLAAAVRRAAATLPHPALRAAAAEHADFLADQALRRAPRYRQVLLTARQPVGAGGDRQAAARAAARRLDDAAALLAPAGVALRLLDGPRATALLAEAANPGLPPPPPGPAATGVVTGPPTPSTGTAPTPPDRPVAGRRAHARTGGAR